MSTRLRRFTLLCAALLLFYPPTPAAAQVTPGQVDPTFDAGVVEWAFGSSAIRAVVLQPDGRILVGGAFSSIAGVTRHSLARLNADGSVDPTFAPPFFVNRRVVDVLAMVLQADGRILIGGSGFNVGNQDYFLARLLPDGSLDPSFTLLPMNATAGIEAIALLPDGRFYIGGDHGSIGGVATRTVTRMHADGTLDPTFAIQAVDYGGRATSIVTEPSGGIIAGGTFSGATPAGAPFGFLTRFSSSGAIDATFKPVFDMSAVPAVKSIVRRSDGTIYAGGLFRTLNGSPAHSLVRLDPTTGARIAAFDPPVHPSTDDFRAIRFDLEGRLLVTGNLYFPGVGPSGERRGIARLDADTGAVDAFYPPNGLEMGGIGEALAVQADAKVLVVGAFVQLGGGFARWRVARLLDVPNTPPVAVPDAYSATGGLPLVVPSPGVLGNDTDAEGDPLTAMLVTPPASGTVTLLTDGSFTYTPAPGFAGTVTFSYAAHDGHDPSAPAAVSIAALPPLVISGSTGGTIPGGGGTYTGFPGAPGVGGRLSAFLATGSTGLQGVFGCVRTIPTDPCQPLATTSAAIPGGTGPFTAFSNLSVAPSLVAFIGAGSGGQLGAFLCDRTIPTDPCLPLATRATPIPGGAGSFAGFSELAVASSPAAGPPAAFIGSGTGQLGVFLCDRFMPGNGCAPLVTSASGIPGAAGSFAGFRGLSLAVDAARTGAPVAVSFVGVGGSGHQGVYRCDASIPTDPCQPLASTATAIPGGTSPFTGFGAVAAGGRFTAFIGSGAGQAGVYRCDTAIPTDPCQPVATLASAIPGGTGPFIGFSAVSSALGHTAFLGHGAGGQAGIYVASVPRQIVAVGDAIAGRTIASLTFGRDGFDGAQIAFGARFTDQTEGVFVADVTLPANTAPIAHDDSASTLEDAAVTVDVVANDADADVGDALAVGSVTPAAHGVVAITGPRRVIYTPAANYSGPDSFTYAVYDGHGGSDTAVVTVGVTAVNDGPVAAGESYTTPADAILNVIAPGVLLNDVDPDGTPLTAALVTGATHGTVLLGASGAFVYTPAAHYSGPDAFTYRASDGVAASNVVTVSITVTRATPTPAGWRLTGGLRPTGGGPANRTGHTATLLENGMVLVAGGSGTSTDTPRGAQLYDPATGAWSITGSLGQMRSGHTATRLANGKVLVAGGYRLLGAATPVGLLDSCELYDPATGTWTSTGSLRATAGGSGARAGHTATLLPNGAVLVVGGIGVSLDTPRSTQLYDPATGAWSIAASMAAPRAGHTATLLADGKVLIAGGLHILAAVLPIGFLDGALLFDPATGRWTPTGGFAGSAAGGGGRAGHTATRLADGRVLVAGGAGSNPEVPRWVQLYDPVSGSWTRGGELPQPRMNHTATLLADGRVLIAGGLRIVTATSLGATTSAVLFEPASGALTATASLNAARTGFTATRLPDGEVVAVAGIGVGGLLSSAERYQP